MSRLNELRNKRHEKITAIDTIIDTAEKEKRELDAVENQNYDKLLNEAENLKAEIEREERREELRRETASQAAQNLPQNEGGNAEEVRAQNQLEGFRSWLKNGKMAGDSMSEFRALQADSDTAGGFMVAPQQFVSDLIKAIDDMLFIRQFATVYSVPTADSLGAPSLDNDPDDAEWTAEVATGNEDSSMSFGKRNLQPHPFAKRIKVSTTLMRKSILPVENIVMQRLAYKFGITEEKGFLTGSGSNQPLGIYTASNDGIPTSRDISTGNTATSITADGLIETEYSLKDQYRANARWNFHRDALKQIRKLKDGEGRYLLDLRNGTLNDRPYHSSEYAPNTFTTGQYVGVLGDFKYYWIADAMSMAIQRLDELYAETNQTGFIGRKETDGAPVLAEAFARLKLA